MMVITTYAMIAVDVQQNHKNTVRTIRLSKVCSSPMVSTYPGALDLACHLSAPPPPQSKVPSMYKSFACRNTSISPELGEISAREIIFENPTRIVFIDAA